jgi:hypothetical protein
MPLLASAYSEARLDLSKLDKDIKAATAKIEKAAKAIERKLKLKVDIDTKAAEQKLKRFERSVDQTRRRLEARSIDLDVNVSGDIAGATDAGRAARESAQRGFGDGDLVATVDLNTRPLDRALRVVQAKLKALAAKRYKVQVDLDYDERGFARLRDTIVGAKESRRLKVAVDYDIDTAAATAEVAKARAELSGLLAETDAAVNTAVAISVELRGGAAVLAEIAAIDAALAALPGDVNVGIDSRGGVPGVGATTPQLGAETLVQELQDAGIEVANLIQGADALRSLFNYDFSPVIKEQVPEFARALASKTRTAITDSIASLKDQAVNISAEGDAGVIARAKAVSEALRTIPETITTRYTVEADRFNDESIRRGVLAAGEAREAAEEVVEQRSLARGLKRRTEGQALRAAQYEKFAAEAEKQAVSLADKAARNLDNRQAQLDATAARATADRRRVNFERLQRGTAALQARAEAAEKELAADLRTSQLEDRQLNITTRWEGYARFIAQLAPANRALDELEATREVGIDVDGFNAKLARAREILFQFDREEVTATLGLDGGALFANLTRIERELGSLDGRQVTAEFDLDGLTASSAELAVFARQLELIDNSEIDVGIDVKGLRRALVELAKLQAAKIAASGDVTINVDVDRGTLPRTLASVARGVGGLVSSIGRGLSAAVGGLSSVGEAGSAVGKQIQEGFSAAGNQIADFAQQAGKLAGAVSSAAGPVGSAVAAIVGALAGPALVGTIVGAVAALAGPVIAGVGGLIGGAIAFLGASAVAGLAAGGLPIAAVLLGPAKEELKKLLTPLKNQLLEAFAPTTDLIVQRIAPAFAAVASQLIPVVASVSEAFITPITDSLFNLFASPALADAITRLSVPMAEGISSIIDTFAKYVPLFTDIALQIGPPITDAVNSILEVVFTLGEVFAGDIAGAFRVIGDLFNDIRPTLASLGPILEPLVGLLAALIKAFVDASAGIEATVGPIGPIIDDIAAAVPQAVPGLIALGQAFVQLLGYLPEIIAAFGVFAATVTATMAVAAGAVYVVLKAVGILAKGITGFVDLAFGVFADLLGIAGTVAGALGLDDFGNSLSAASVSLDLARAEATEFGNAMFDAGDAAYGAANGFGNATDTALGLGDSLKPVGDAALTAQQKIAALDASLRTGKIGFAEYADAVGTVDSAGIAFAGVIDGLVKRAGEGAFAIGTFAADVEQSLGSAADYVETFTIKDPVGQLREDRDRARAMQDLERQSARDVEQIGRNVEDYEQAIRDAAEIRAEAPKQYTFGARNFNRALFEDAAKRQQEYDERLADAERNISDRARSIEDARRAAEDSAIALEDAKYDAIFGEPEDIEVKSINIQAALEREGKKIGDTAAQTLTLIQIRSKGLDFDPLADFLEKLDPEQFQQAIDQLGGVESEAFAAAAAKLNAEVDKGNTSFAQGLADRRNLIKEESLRIQRLTDLTNAGALALVEDLSKIESAAEFNAVFESAQNGPGGLAGAEAQLDSIVDVELPALMAQAEAAGLKVSTATEEAFNKGVTAAQTAAAAKFGKEGLGAFSIFGDAGAGGNGPGGLRGLIGLDPEGAASDAAAAGGAAAGALIEGFTGEFATERGQAVAKGISALAADVETGPWATAGRTSATAFTEAFGTTLTSGGGVGAGGIFGPNGAGGSGALGPVSGLVAKIRSNTQPFSFAGVALGAAVVGGIIGAILARVPLVLLAVQTLALATLRATGQWGSAGSALAAAFLTALANTIIAAASTVSNAVQQLVSQLNLNVLVGAGVNIGTAIVAGLIQGILNGREGVENAARIIARAAADASAKELGINSPSKVFMELGASTAEGFALGVQQGAVGIGSGVGAALTGQVSTATTQAVYNQQQSTTTTDQSVTESNVFYVSNPDPYATAAEIAQRQRSRRYLNGGKR